MHGTKNTKEVNGNQAGELELQIVKQAFHDLLDHEGDPNQGCDHDEAQLPGGEEWRPVNRTDGKLGFGLDEIGHQLGELREIALVHMLRLLEGLVWSDEANVREGIEFEESEALLRLFEQLQLQLQYSQCCKRRGYVNLIFFNFLSNKISISISKKKKKEERGYKLINNIKKKKLLISFFFFKIKQLVSF